MMTTVTMPSHCVQCDPARFSSERRLTGSSREDVGFSFSLYCVFLIFGHRPPEQLVLGRPQRYFCCCCCCCGCCSVSTLPCVACSERSAKKVQQQRRRTDTLCEYCSTLYSAVHFVALWENRPALRVQSFLGLSLRSTRSTSRLCLLLSSFVPV